MTTASDLINETKRYLLSSHREQLNQLSGGINSAVTSISLTYTMGSLGAGSVVSMDLEIMYVWSADATAKTAVVQRGYLGSTAAAHNSGAIVTVNPKFPDFSILQAINADISDMSGDLYKATTSTFTYVAGKDGYDLAGATNVIGGLEARYDYPGVRRYWPLLHNFYIRRNSNTTDFPSTFSVILIDEAFPGREVRITYAAELHPLSALADDVLTVTGLPTGAHDVPPLGAAVRLQGVREGQRNFNDSQPDTRRAVEVPTGAQLQSMRAVADFRRARIMSEMKILQQMYPHRTRVI